MRFFIFYLFFSSLSVYVHNCDSLDIPDDEKEQLNACIDQLYVDMEQGKNADNGIVYFYIT